MVLFLSSWSGLGSIKTVGIGVQWEEKKGNSRMELTRNSGKKRD